MKATCKNFCTANISDKKRGLEQKEQSPSFFGKQDDNHSFITVPRGVYMALLAAQHHWI